MGFDFDAIRRMADAKQPEPAAAPPAAQVEQIIRLPPEELMEFPSELHKFKPASEKRMEELMESIRRNGIINPLIIRRLQNGKYQLVAGHNRRTAAVRLGYSTVPCIVKILPNVDDAIGVMVDDNLNNRELLPSERGWAYRQLMEVQGRRGYRTDLRDRDLTSDQHERKLETAEQIGEKNGDSKAKVRRYIRLTHLIDPLLELVDGGKIGVGTGAQLSYLKQRNQETVYAYCYESEPSHPLKEAQAKTLREVQADPDRIIDEDLLEELTAKQKKVRFRTLKLEMSRLRDYFPTGTPEEVVVQTIHTALAVYFEGKEE